MERVKLIDKDIFWLLNSSITHPFLDRIMPWITDIWNLLIPLIVITLGFVLYGRGRGRKIVFILLLLTGVILLDKSAALLKDIFQRVRPCHIYDDVRLLVGCTGSFSMPSNHAANVFFVSTILSYFYKKLLTLFLVVAFMVSYSRVYVGVHYPGDVLVGAVLGLLFGIIFITLSKSRYIYGLISTSKGVDR